MNTFLTTVKNVPAVFARTSKAKKMALAAAAVSALTFADGAFFFSNASGEGGSGNVTSGMTTALTSAFGNVQTDVTSIITTALPYALGVMGLIIAIRVGVKFFKGTAK